MSYFATSLQKNTWKEILSQMLTGDYTSPNSQEFKTLTPLHNIDGANYGESWNLSVRELQELISGLFDADAIDDDGFNTYCADAGAQFGKPWEVYEEKKWVKPWTNIDSDNYSEVRNEDKIVPILNADNKLQFTLTQRITECVCRLLMPAYDRRVEAEDLNRNFWVIAQILGRICDVLFNPENGLQKVLKSIIDEIAQLWENVAYLWAAAGILLSSYKPLVLTGYVPYTFFGTNFKMDYLNRDQFNHNDPNTLAEFDDVKDNGADYIYHLLGQNSFQYFVDNYQKRDLVYIPQIRTGAYGSNNFSKVILPGVLIYNHKMKTFFFLEFRHEDRGVLFVDMLNKRITFRTKDTENHLINYSYLQEIAPDSTHPRDGKTEKDFYWKFKYENANYCATYLQVPNNFDVFNFSQHIALLHLVNARNNRPMYAFMGKMTLDTPANIGLLPDNYRIYHIGYYDIRIDEDSLAKIPNTTFLPYIGDVISYYA